MDLTVARAVLVSALLKTDPAHKAPDVRREDANVFPKTVLRTLNVCTKTDIKATKAFVVQYALPSAARTAAFIKYLGIVAKASKPEDGELQERSRTNQEYEGLAGIVDGKVQQPPNPIFRRLHALYIVHDLLAFTVLRLKKEPQHSRAFHVDDLALQHLQHAVPILAQLAVCADGKPSYASSEALEIVQGLLATWETHSILPTPITSELHASLQEASTSTFADLLSSLADDEAQAALNAQRTRDEAGKWLIPNTHHLPHDPTAPWHELPAANGLFQKRTQGYPLRAGALPPGGYSLQNAGRRADEATRKEVEELFAEAKRCFDKYTDPAEVQDIDALGNIIWKPNTGRKRRNHWGWSYEGIEQKRRAADAESDYEP